MTLVPSTTNSSVPPAATRSMNLFVARFTNRLEDPENGSRLRRMPRSAAPDADQREWLEHRRDTLRASLVPTPGSELNRELSKLMGAHAQFGATDREMLGKVALYAEAVQDLPTWAVAAARRAFTRPNWKSLWSGRGCPEAADLVAECRFILLPIETELTRIESILSAQVYDAGATDEERQQVLDHVDDVLGELRSNGGMIAQRTDDEIAAEAGEMERVNERFRERDRAMAAGEGRGSATWGRLPISDELARQIGLGVPRPDFSAGFDVPAEVEGRVAHDEYR